MEQRVGVTGDRSVLEAIRSAQQAQLEHDTKNDVQLELGGDCIDRYFDEHGMAPEQGAP